MLHCNFDEILVNYKAVTNFLIVKIGVAGAKPYKHTQILTRNVLVTVESNLKGI